MPNILYSRRYHASVVDTKFEKTDVGCKLDIINWLSAMSYQTGKVIQSSILKPFHFISAIFTGVVVRASASLS